MEEAGKKNKKLTKKVNDSALVSSQRPNGCTYHANTPQEKAAIAKKELMRKRRKEVIHPHDLALAQMPHGLNSFALTVYRPRLHDWKPSKRLETS